MDYEFWCFRALCMGLTAYLAHKRGKNPWLWGAMAYPLFLFAPLVLLYVTRQKARSLQQYLAQYPIAVPGAARLVPSAIPAVSGSGAAAVCCPIETSIFATTAAHICMTASACGATANEAE
ncbi:hypothetical protein D8I24_0048 (plasmid) [Cupriavidus necator H850]|uniref:hypothetical protein n=1 Tax=Cupriavidus necator TaxID=106590 RepID=UPI00129D3F4B|nr:hypothetical protein [Cupriavidus necator]KAI3611790.1 hypothetical protein D8I24_0048 [Cupriavidus necator H850]